MPSSSPKPSSSGFSSVSFSIASINSGFVIEVYHPGLGTICQIHCRSPTQKGSTMIGTKLYANTKPCYSIQYARISIWISWSSLLVVTWPAWIGFGAESEGVFDCSIPVKRRCSFLVALNRTENDNLPEDVGKDMHIIYSFRYNNVGRWCTEIRTGTSGRFPGELWVALRWISRGRGCMTDGLYLPIDIIKNKNEI